jgi:hypothetical protein
MRELVPSRSSVAAFGTGARAFALRFSWEAAARQTEAHLRVVVGDSADLAAPQA